MTAPLPQGLIRIVSATQTEEPSDPADVIYERKQALHNFWKVHDAQSRTTHDPSSIRCRQLFWRVWSHRYLSLSLSQSTMMQLWVQCQRDFNLSPFELRIESSSSSAFQVSSTSSTQRRPSKESQRSSSLGSISPAQGLLDEASFVQESTETNKRNSKSRASIQTIDSRPSTNRTLSGESGRKRPNVTMGAARGRTRPTMTRKKSSQAGPSTQPVPPSEDSKPRKSIIKSPRTSAEEQNLVDERRESRTAMVLQMTATPTTAAEPPGRKISTFELPSASSWQSVESHAEPTTAAVSLSTSQPKSPLIIDKNFRDRFQDQLRSSTNLTGMEKVMRKTGSVVRFADEVDVPEDFRQPKGASRQRDISTPQSNVGESWRRSSSESQKPPSDAGNQSKPWRPKGIERHDSVGSVAAVDDYATNVSDTEAVAVPIPRTKSQLSMAIADLRRSQSLGEQEAETSFAVTSPQIEKEQEALISGKQGKKPSEEEENLLAMGRKDGVTKAGGVNLPKELMVEGKFELPGGGYESPEEPLY